MAKKKYINILYMFSLVVLCVIFLGFFSSCYAMTTEEYTSYLDNVKSIFMEQEGANFNETNYNNLYSTIAISNLRLNEITSIIIFQPPFGNYYGLYTYDNTKLKLCINGNNVAFYNYSNSTVYVNQPSQRDYVNSNNYRTITDKNKVIVSDENIYTSSNSDEIFENTNIYYPNAAPPNTIQLISASNHKFGFTDTNQCQAYLTGYNIEDIQFYVDRLLNNEWQQFTDASDYYLLNNEINPYYIFWANMNYFPVGTYRYRAVYDNDNQYTSSTFSITNSIIENEGTYNNGNISIDTGNTIDNIKDFLGGSPETTENEIKDSFPSVEIEDPTHNFFTWIFEQIEDIFLTTENKTFSISLFTGNTYTINSNSITVPNSPLKTLVGLSVDFGICYYILKDIHKTIEKVKKGSFENIAEEDITANMV